MNMRNCNLLKAISIVIFATVLLTACASTSSGGTTPAPKWLTSPEELYPSKDYLYEIGYGATEKEALAEGLAALSRSISTSIETDTVASQYMTSTEQGSSSIRSMDTTTRVKSQLENISGLHNTEGWYNPKDGRIYMMVYINRQEAWTTSYEKKLKERRDAFNAYYNEAEINTVDDPLLALQYFRQAEVAGAEYTDMMNLTRIIYAEGENYYERDRSTVSGIAKRAMDMQSSLTFNLVIVNDYNRIIETKVVDLFSVAGIKVKKNAANTDYTITVDIADNLEVENRGTEDEIHVVYPALTITVNSRKNGRNLFSFGLDGRKYPAYNKDVAMRKGYTALAGSLDDSMTDEFTKAVFGSSR